MITIKTGQLEIMLNVQIVPTVVHIDRLDLVLEGNAESNNVKT